MVGGGSGLLQDCVGSDHLARDQILADTEMLERTLSLSAPELVGRDFDHAEAICFFPCGGHVILLGFDEFSVLTTNGSRDKQVSNRRLRRPPWPKLAELLEADCDRCPPCQSGAHICPQTSWHRNSRQDAAHRWHHLQALLWER